MTALSIPTIPPYYPMDAKARIELGAQLRSSFDENKRVFKYVDLKRIGKGNIRTTVRQLLMRYPDDLVKRIGDDVYELKQKVIDNESEILSEAKRYLEAIYGPIKPQMDGSETGFAGSDVDGVPENHETDFEHLDDVEKTDGQEPRGKNPSAGKPGDDDSKKAENRDADNIVNMDQVSVRAKSTPRHF